jgi:hypothetical protein
VPPPRRPEFKYFVRRGDPTHDIEGKLGDTGVLWIHDVEGVQGSGKTTVLTQIYDEVRERNAGRPAWVSVSGLRPASRRDDSLESLERDFYAFCDVIDAYARDLGLMDFTNRIGDLRETIADVPERDVHVHIEQNVKLGILSRIEGDVKWGSGAVHVEPDELAPEFFRRVIELARMKIRDEFAERLRSLAPSGRPVLFADDFELALDGQLGEWFLELVAKLDDALVIVARAESLLVLGGLAGALVELKLTNFDQDDIRSFLAERLDGADVPEGLAERIEVLTGGHPQAVVVAADLIRSHGVDQPDVLELFDDVRGQLKDKLGVLVRRLVDEIGEDDIRQAVEIGSVLRRFDASALNSMLDRTEDDEPLIDDLCQFSFTEQHVQPETREPYYRFHEFIRSDLDAQLERTKPTHYKELHARAAVYYSAWLTECEESDRDKAAYCRAYRYERPEWQAMVHEWLYHLSRLDDEQASLEVARVYLAAFWWWGCYLRFPFCERLLREWELEDERPRVKEVTALLRAFQSSYPPEAEPEVVHEDWLKVEDSIAELIDLESEAKVGLDPDAAWRRSQLRAYLEIFFAHARRGQDSRDLEINAAFGRAYDLFAESGREEDQWNLPWIAYELADLAFERDDLAEAAAKAEEAIALARDDDLAEQDNEVVANAHRLLGDVAWQEGETERAVNQYGLATLHAYAFQGLPNPADFYTITFYDRMAQHLSERVRDLPDRVPAERAAQIVSEMHVFWSEYWRRVGEPVLPADPHELLAAYRIDELTPYLLPLPPRENDVGAGSEYVATAKRVAKATFARLAKA